MYLTLQKVKKHLNINEEFIEDDKYLLDITDAAERIVERHLDNKLEVLAGQNGGELPSPILSAMLLMIGNLYENREAVSYSTAVEVPISYDYILSLYKNYSQRFNV